MGEQQAADRQRDWTCGACGATLGVLTLARREPPALRPLAALVAIKGGVVQFRCPGCGALAEWRIRSAA